MCLNAPNAYEVLSLHLSTTLIIYEIKDYAITLWKYNVPQYNGSRTQQNPSRFSRVDPGWAKIEWWVSRINAETWSTWSHLCFQLKQARLQWLAESKTESNETLPQSQLKSPLFLFRMSLIKSPLSIFRHNQCIKSHNTRQVLFLTVD